MKKTIFLNNNSKTKLIKKDDIDFLKKQLSGSRICLHQNNYDSNQEMIISQSRLKFFPPKKNLLTDQTFTIIKGKLLILIFDNKGHITQRNILTKLDNIICRVKKGVYHCDIPISKTSVHLESNNQSFKKRKIVFLNKKYHDHLIKEIQTIQNK